MKIRMAHLRDQGIDFAVFAADAATHLDSDRDELLGELITKARRNGLKVDKGALAFKQGSKTYFHGTPDLVKYLASRGGISQWTHEIEH